MIYLYENINTIPYPKVLNMPEERVQKLKNYKNEEDKKMCYATFKLLKYALEREYAIYLDRKMKFGYTIRGKPYLLEYHHIHFNISHSYPVAACFVSNGSAGIDVQTIVPQEDIQIIKLIGSSKEIENLEKARDSRNYFTRIWTLKECYLKMLGNGLDDNLSNYDFGKFNTPVFSTLGCDFFSILMGEYHLSICKKVLYSNDKEIIKM